MKAITIALMTAAFFVMAQLVPAQNWTLTSAPSLSWYSVASSADGNKLVVVGNDTGIYTSTNSGTTWTLSPFTGGMDFTSVASSTDGVKLATANFDGYGILVSTNSGATWQFTSVPSYQYYAIASSADGTKLEAARYSGGPLYGSTNSGANWTQLTYFSQSNVRSIASSADGHTLVVAATKLTSSFGQGGIFTSTNSGQTWIQVTSVPNHDWDSVASSADGTKLVAAPQYDSIYISTNSGTSWSATLTPSEVWVSVASSADGTKLIAGSLSVVYTSIDSGITWTSNSLPSGYWNSVASSADGNKLVAVNDSGSLGIWTWQFLPTLSILPSDGIISWSTNTAGFVLQQNNDIGTTNWIDIATTPTVTNGQNQVILPMTNSKGFYRLKMP